MNGKPRKPGPQGEELVRVANSSLLVLHPRVAPGNSLRIWAGAFSRQSPPALRWSLNGQPAVPRVMRPMESARSADMLDRDSPRAFTGIFEFRGLAPDRHYRVEAETGQQRAHLETWTMPDEVPEGFNNWFHVLLVSCFHSEEDKAGLAGEVAQQIRKAIRPHLSLFLGDQVYLDLPTERPFRNNLSWLANDFEQKYRHNWSNERGALRMFNAAPGAFLADDHEYWNNYPHPATVVRLSWLKEGRENWECAARRLYEAFQLGAPTALGQAEIVNVAPLSFFLADTRNLRDEKRRFAIHPDWLPQLSAWVDDVKARKWFGVFVASQSIFDAPAGPFKGRIADWHLADYGDYKTILEKLENLAAAGRPVLFVAGDVHWGRVMEGRRRADGRAFAFEVISSPSSLVTTIGKDQLSVLGSAIAGLFGRKVRWPRHSDPRTAPGRFKLGQTICSFERLHGQKGDQLATLSFNRVGGSLKCMIRHWEVDPRYGYVGPARPVHIDLRPEA